ncbi:hypothetical protein SLS59_003268 [Nothophoma quercina]|uniref:Ankyrin repeat protein n=1 Tax=Nothophoma quercina TaxID=749835 RepID=A0ABR3RLZ9_9PLEO
MSFHLAAPDARHIHSLPWLTQTRRTAVIPDISSFARQVREARTDLNAINNDLQIIRTGLGVAQDDFSTFGSKLPTALVDAFTQILDSSDDTSERLHKSFLKLSCSTAPKDDWRVLKDGTLIILRQDLEASRIVLDLAVDYLSFNFGPSRGTFYTDDGVSSSRTLVAPESRESRLKKSRSWCSEASTRLDVKPKTRAKTRLAQEYSPTVSSSDVSIIHKRITSDKIAVAKGNRKDLDIDSRIGVDRILANIPSDATSGEVERVLWEGANPMVAHPGFGFFFIRAAHDMSSDILRVLMEYGADITRTTTNKYYSAMHAAVLGGQLEIVKSLTSLGHSIDATNTLGETPLHLAARTPGAQSREIARFLADKGADVNHEANNGNSPLQMALTAKKLEGRERSLMIELLLSCGAEGELNQDLEGRRSNSKGMKIMGIT